MNRLIAVSQRVDVIADRVERRDALDQRWHDFLSTCGFLAVPLPNRAAEIPALLDGLSPAGVILSGGNDIGDAPERDAAERAMVAWAKVHKRPVLGVCRGLQFLVHESGGKLEKVGGHVAVRHDVSGNGGTRNVNSYHGWGFTAAPKGFEITARAGDGSIEGLRHTSEPVVGIMWHPEREATFDKADIQLVQSHFKAGS